MWGNRCDNVRFMEVVTEDALYMAARQAHQFSPGEPVVRNVKDLNSPSGPG